MHLMIGKKFASAFGLEVRRWFIYARVGRRDIFVGRL